MSIQLYRPSINGYQTFEQSRKIELENSKKNSQFQNNINRKKNLFSRDMTNYFEKLPKNAIKNDIISNICIHYVNLELLWCFSLMVFYPSSRLMNYYGIFFFFVNPARKKLFLSIYLFPSFFYLIRPTALYMFLSYLLFPNKIRLFFLLYFRSR